jgi:hypothetical protein
LSLIRVEGFYGRERSREALTLAKFIKLEKTMSRLKSTISALLLAACSVLPSAAQQSIVVPPSSIVVPAVTKFAGILMDGNGKPISGITGVTFSLYKDEQGGAALWMETQNVTPDKNGHYSVVLGSTSAHGLPSDIFASGEARWLGVQPEGQNESPRVLLVSVPYALKAADAQTLGGMPASAFLKANANGSKLSSNGPANPSYTGTGKAHYIPLWLSPTKLGDSELFQSPVGNLGLGTTTPAAMLDVNGAADFRNTLTLFPSGSSPALTLSGTTFGITNTGVVNFVSGQTFPGTGSISGVTAGTGLTGGGTSGSVTLNIDPTKVPEHRKHVHQQSDDHWQLHHEWNHRRRHRELRWCCGRQRLRAAQHYRFGHRYSVHRGIAVLPCGRRHVQSLGGKHHRQFRHYRHLQHGSGIRCRRRQHHRHAEHIRGICRRSVDHHRI